MIHYIKQFLKECDFPLTSIDFLIQESKKFLTQDEFIQSTMLEYQKDYKKFDYTTTHKKLHAIFKNLLIDERTGYLLFYIILTQELAKLYKQHSIATEIFKNTIVDLKYKAIECKKTYGIWGLSRVSWYERIFNLNLFALGRLQFHIIELGHDFNKNGLHLCKTDLVINIHIPSSGKLIKEDCIHAFKKAKIFFAHTLKKDTLVFVCNSWLLFPRQREFLNEKSNILMFMDFFDIYDYTEEEEFSDAWRIFDKPFTKDIEPKTPLQKDYYNFLIKGNKAGTGRGLFVL